MKLLNLIGLVLIPTSLTGLVAVSTSCGSNPETQDYGDDWTQYFEFDWLLEPDEPNQKIEYPFRALAHGYTGHYIGFKQTTEWELDSTYNIITVAVPGAKYSNIAIEENWTPESEPFTHKFAITTTQTIGIMESFKMQIKKGSDTKILKFTVEVYSLIS